MDARRYEERYRLWEAGWSDRQIAQQVNRNHKSIQNWRHRHGLTANAMIGSPDWYCCLPGLMDRRELLLRLEEKGLTNRQISAALGVSINAVKQRRRRANNRAS